MTETSTGATATAHPTDYRIAVPDGWERIILEPTTWDDRIAAIVERQFKGVDNAPHLKAQLRDQLRAQAEAGRANGGLELYLSLMQLGNVPLPGGLLVSLIPPRPGSVPPPLEDLAVAFAADGADVRMIDLPAGPAMRRFSWQQPDPAETGNTMPVAHLDIEVAVPGTGAHLLLSFSTPMAPLAGPLTELFESIATTLRWVR